MSFAEKTVLGSSVDSTEVANPVNGSLPSFAAGWQSPIQDAVGPPVVEGNSTITATDSFTGDGELNAAEGVQVSFKADTTGTLYFDFSNDGTNWDTFPTSGFEIASGVHEFHTAVKGPRYFRVRWVGDSVPTYLRIYTYYGQFRQPNAPLNQPLGLDADATLVRPTFPWLDISRGLVSGMTSTKKFGRNAAVGTTMVPLCLGGVWPTPQASGATTLRIKAGGDAADTAAGAGAREITIEGLDENWLFASETLATAGASASSATTTTFTRVNRAFVSASGSYANASTSSHAASITIEDGAGTQDWFTIDIDDLGFSQTEVGAYAVAAGKTAYIFLDDIIIDSGKTVKAIFFHRGGIDETAPPYSAMRAKSVLPGLTGGIAPLSGRVIPFGPFVGPCDIGFMAKVGSTTGSVACEFEIFELDE